MINARLTTFAKNLVVSRNSTEKEKIDRSIDALQRNIERYFGNEVAEVMIFGSYTRNTILPRKYDPNSDVDLMVIFDTESRELKPATYRQKLHDLVNSYYPRSYSKKDAPAIKLELNHIMFDLVPAIQEQKTWWRPERYYVPDGQDWVETKPNLVNADLAAANQKYGGNLVRHIVRLCKHWNAAFGYPYRSFELESEIVDMNFRGDDTFAGFIFAMGKLGGDIAGVSQALYWIEEYAEREDEAKQVLWLRKLLPEF